MMEDGCSERQYRLLLSEAIYLTNWGDSISLKWKLKMFKISNGIVFRIYKK